MDHGSSDQDSQGEFPDRVTADPRSDHEPDDREADSTGEFTASEIPGEPEHRVADPGTGQFTDSELPDEPNAAEHHGESQYTNSELPEDPDAAQDHHDGEYTDSER